MPSPSSKTSLQELMADRRKLTGVIVGLVVLLALVVFVVVPKLGGSSSAAGAPVVRGTPKVSARAAAGTSTRPSDPAASRPVVDPFATPASFR